MIIEQRRQDKMNNLLYLLKLKSFCKQFLNFRLEISLIDKFSSKSYIKSYFASFMTSLINFIIFYLIRIIYKDLKEKIPVYLIKLIE